MLKIFITVVLAVFVGGILVKYWKEILSLIAMVIAIVLAIVVGIIVLPLDIVTSNISDDTLEKMRIRNYDRIFYEVSSIKHVKKYEKKIRNYTKTLQARKEERQEKEVKKILKEAKWLL